MRARELLIVILLASVVIGGIVALPVSAVHQSDTTPTPSSSEAESGPESDSSSSTPEDTDEGDGADDTVVRQVDDRLTVTSYHYDRNASVMAITFANHGESSSSVSITEGISREAAESTSRFGLMEIRVPSGETRTAELELYTAEPIGVMITTSRSRSQGRGSFIAIPDEGSSVVEGDPAWSDVQVAAFFGVLLTLAAFTLGIWHVWARRFDSVELADLDPRRSSGRGS